MEVINLTEEGPVYGDSIPRQGWLGEKDSGLVVANWIGAMLMEEVSKEKALKL